MNPLAAIRDSPWLPPSRGRELPADDEAVQAVVVGRPRDSIVSVHVEVVSESSAGPDALPPSAARAQEGAQAYAREAALFFPEVETPRAAENLGAPDARRAAAAYSAQADWRGYGQPNASMPPALLSLRA